MSEHVKQNFKVNNQDLQVDINLLDNAKFVSYEFSSTDALHPVTVAMAMLCIIQTIFIDNKLDILDVLRAREKSDDDRNLQ